MYDYINNKQNNFFKQTRRNGIDENYATCQHQQAANGVSSDLASLLIV
jgi:hypothetical protein